MEKMGTLKKNGDQKTYFGPHGDQSPQMGTNVGAVLLGHKLIVLENSEQNQQIFLHELPQGSGYKI